MRKLPAWLAVIFTNVVVAFAWIFFRAENFAAASNMIMSFGHRWDTAAAAGYLADFDKHLMLRSTTDLNCVVSGITFLIIAYSMAIAVRTQTILAWYQNIMSQKYIASITLAIVAAWATSYALFLQAGMPIKFIYFDF